ncbi:hypothetical protein IWGMT90018_36950 [Mycobacterium kiyosense]|nr:hypothetical protein IWGMT90018_36950 [Mycobacterium kiyosense]
MIGANGVNSEVSAVAATLGANGVYGTTSLAGATATGEPADPAPTRDLPPPAARAEPAGSRWRPGVVTGRLWAVMAVPAVPVETGAPAV